MAMMLFTFFPILIDLGVAFVYLYELFGSNMALLVGFVSVFYLWISTWLSRHQGASKEQLARIYQRDGFDLWKQYGSWTAILVCCQADRCGIMTNANSPLVELDPRPWLTARNEMLWHSSSEILDTL